MLKRFSLLPLAFFLSVAAHSEVIEQSLPLPEISTAAVAMSTPIPVAVTSPTVPVPVVVTPPVALPLPVVKPPSIVVPAPVVKPPPPITLPPPPVLISTAIPTPPVVTISTAPPMTLTMIHPNEGLKLPPLGQVFVFGAVTPGSTLTINGQVIPVHAKGGYLAVLPVIPGEILFHVEAHGPNGSFGTLDRHFFVSSGFQIMPASPLAISHYSVTPEENMLMQPGDVLRVYFQGTPNATAAFVIGGGVRSIPMAEIGLSTAAHRGLYEGFYAIPPGMKASNASIQVLLKKNGKTVWAMAPGHLTVDSGEVPRAGLIIDDIVAVRTGPTGGYDLFLYKGMRVRLTGKVGNEWRVRLSSLQSGWIKESSVLALPVGSASNQAMLTNMTIAHESDDTLIRIPLGEMLPYRVEQSLDPTQLILTLYGSTDKTDLIRGDPLDPLIRIVRWKQIAPDTTQVIIEPTFKTWWGFDVHYEGTTLTVEIRPPWTSNNLNGMVIAVDPGHGGQDSGAVGPHATVEKEANLEIARVVRDALKKAGAQPFLTRDSDMDVSLYDRPRIAWGKRARLFVSVHCNASGEEENPLWNNGFSIYWYRPQSLALAEAVHGSYRKTLTLPDHGLYYADLAVCRMTQMPAILTEQAFIIVPEQEEMLFDPKFQKNLATAIVNGIKSFLEK